MRSFDFTRLFGVHLFLTVASIWALLFTAMPSAATDDGLHIYHCNCVGVELEEPVPDVCEVYICTKMLPSEGGGGSWFAHTYITCKGADGALSACRGGPAGLDGDMRKPEARRTDAYPCGEGWGFFNGAWGAVDTYCGPFTKDHPDWPRADESGTEPDPALWPLQNCGDVLGAEWTGGQNCAACECIAEFFDCIRGCCLRYECFPELYGDNCNSVAFSALAHCLGGSGGERSLNQLSEEYVRDLKQRLRPYLGPRQYAWRPGWGVLVPETPPSLGNCHCFE